MDENQCGGVELQGALDHLARIDRRVVDRSRALHLVGDEGVLLVEEENAELLARLMGHRRRDIIENGGPGGQDLALPDRFPHRSAVDRRDDGQIQRNGVFDARHFGQEAARRAEHFAQGAETGDQGLGDRLDVASGNGAEQDELEELIIGEGVGAGFAEALAQPVAMAVMMAGFALGLARWRPFGQTRNRLRLRKAGLFSLFPLVGTGRHDAARQAATSRAGSLMPGVSWPLRERVKTS